MRLCSLEGVTRPSPIVRTSSQPTGAPTTGAAAARRPAWCRSPPHPCSKGALSSVETVVAAAEATLELRRSLLNASSPRGSQKGSQKGFAKGFAERVAEGVAEGVAPVVTTCGRRLASWWSHTREPARRPPAERDDVAEPSEPTRRRGGRPPAANARRPPPATDARSPRPGLRRTTPCSPCAPLIGRVHPDQAMDIEDVTAAPNKSLHGNAAIGGQNGPSERAPSPRAEVVLDEGGSARSTRTRRKAMRSAKTRRCTTRSSTKTAMGGVLDARSTPSRYIASWSCGREAPGAPRETCPRRWPPRLSSCRRTFAPSRRSPIRS